MILMKSLQKQTREELSKIQQHQWKIYSQMQESSNIFNKEWDKWTMPQKIKRVKILQDKR